MSLQSTTVRPPPPSGPEIALGRRPSPYQTQHPFLSFSVSSNTPKHSISWKLSWLWGHHFLLYPSLLESLALFVLSFLCCLSNGVFPPDSVLAPHIFSSPHSPQRLLCTPTIFTAIHILICSLLTPWSCLDVSKVPQTQNIPNLASFLHWLCLLWALTQPPRLEPRPAPFSHQPSS